MAPSGNSSIRQPGERGLDKCTAAMVMIDHRGGPGNNPGRGQAALGISAVLLQVHTDQPIQQRPAFLAQRSALDQDFRKRPRPILGPVLKTGNQVGPINQPVLQSQDAKEQVATIINSCHVQISVLR
jgi:hypothetical protein